MKSAFDDLLLFSLGPVQSYIKTARRTQDLWLGSEVLSHLAHVGLQTVEAVAQGGTKAEILFPAKTKEGKWPCSIPNRFAVLVEPAQAAALGKRIDKAVRAAWKKAAADVQGTFFGEERSSVTFQDIWRRQVDAWLETYWVVWQWQPNASYGDNYRWANQAMGARKNLRPIPHHAEPGEKCTLCGVREVLHGDPADERRVIRKYWERIAGRHEVTGAEVRPGERLCAVCSIKRFAGKVETRIGERQLTPPERFPSTSSIASAPFRADLLQDWNDELRKALRAHVDVLIVLGGKSPLDVQIATVQRVKARLSVDLGELAYSQPDALLYLQRLANSRKEDSLAQQMLYFDGRCFYRESFEHHLTDLVGPEPTDDDQAHAQAAVETLGDLLKGGKGANIEPPHKYYALIALDGDHMGQLLGTCSDKAQHQAVSQALVTFAEKRVPQIVENDHCGRVVYAGGDDVLALVPVREALAVADALRGAFEETMRDAIGAGVNGTSRRTASAGIAISHHTQPLEYALNAARRGERKAKGELGRDAVMVVVLRRSGEEREVGSKWGVNEQAAVTIMQEVENAMRAEDLSGKVAYDLQDEATALDGVFMPAAARAAELRRLIGRHWQSPQVTDKRDALLDRLLPLLDASHGAPPAEDDERAEAEIAKKQKNCWRAAQMADWLLLARFLAQGGDA